MPYLTAGTYERFYQVVEPRARQYRDRMVAVAYAGDSRFLMAQIRSNVVLRWEYLPGSTLFLVWTREQTDDRTDLGVVRIDRDLSHLARSQPVDVVMLKLTQFARL